MCWKGQIWILFSFGKHTVVPVHSFVAGTDEVCNERCWMDEWMGVYTDPGAGSVNTGAQKEQRDHVSSSVSWGGGSPASESLGKIAKMQIIGLHPDVLYQNFYRGTREYAFIISLPWEVLIHPSIWDPLSRWSSLMRLCCGKLPVHSPLINKHTSLHASFSQ